MNKWSGLSDVTLMTGEERKEAKDLEREFKAISGHLNGISMGWHLLLLQAYHCTEDLQLKPNTVQHCLQSQLALIESKVREIPSPFYRTMQYNQ